MRVVSLLPSATETLYALGVEPVAVSHECDYPPAATELSTVVHSNVDPDADPADLNEQVGAAAAGDGVYDLDREALRAADPDLVVSQGVCDVCAVDSALVTEAVEATGLDCEVLTTDPHTLGDVLDDIERVGRALDREDRATDLVADLRERVETVERRAADAAADEGRPRALVFDWTDPTMVGGHWVPGMVETAGGEYGLTPGGDPTRRHDWDDVCEFDPEALVVAPCGYELDRAVESASRLAERDGWDDLTAVREGRMHAMDGNAYVNRPGPRLVDTLEHLAGVLHPEHFEAPPANVARRVGVRADV
ncbi:ABC transporter substrate-binding protein [Halobium salinum]|uniref:ABC transporter substrate-binding protein n=1 Tax=Halobium salinum TaxID=1364940 RepID=A0ABD5PCV0_9EURY|nr:ABC transporter substrate-binding protein [Halobium salinum]